MTNKIEYIGSLKQYNDFNRADMVTSLDGVGNTILTEMIVGHWVIIQEDADEDNLARQMQGGA